MNILHNELSKKLAAVTCITAAFLFFVQTIAACSWDYNIWQIRSKNADPLYRFVNHGKAGYIDQTGKIIIKAKLDFYGNYGGEFFAGLLRVSDGAYIDKAGKIVLNTKYYRSWDFSEGLAVAMKEDNGKWGYIDKTGEFVISPQFKSYPNGYVYPFSDGMAMIEVEKRYGYINRTGEFIIEPKFLKADVFQEGLARVIIEGPCSRFDFEIPCDSPETLGATNKNQVSACKYAFINKTGATISDERYYKAKDFSEDLAAVLIEDKWGYINNQGKTVIEPQFDNAESFSDGLARVKKDGFWGYINQQGKVVIPARFEIADNFSDGLAPVGKWNKETDDGEFYFIDKNGQQAIADKFALASFFFKGLAHVKLFPKQKRKVDEDEEKATFAYINTSGKKVFVYERNFNDEE